MRLTSQTIAHAKQIWDYLTSFKVTKKSDALVICCSYDLRVCDHACNLLKQGLADKMVISGKTGNWTSKLWQDTEASVFTQRALENNINLDDIIIENQATNIGENIAFSKALLSTAKTVTFVTKPNTMLRVMLTHPIVWPEISAYHSCPEIIFPDQVSNIIGIWGLINEMVGDIERIKKYPKLGFQVSHELPDNIVDSCAFLINQGFTGHLPNS